MSEWNTGTGFQIGSGGGAWVGRAVWEAITGSIYCKQKVGDGPGHWPQGLSGGGAPGPQALSMVLAMRRPDCSGIQGPLGPQLYLNYF